MNKEKWEERERLGDVCQHIKYLAKLWPKYKPILDKTIEALTEEFTPVPCAFCNGTGVTFKEGHHHTDEGTT